MKKKRTIELHGFNNLAKSLDLNLYLVEHTPTDADKKHFISFVDEHYNSARLMDIMKGVCSDIDATILDVSTYDYEPHGASALLLLAEEDTNLHKKTVAHLDKSHISLHTYPEHHCSVGMSTFRIDISVSTCGDISPLTVLDSLFDFFTPHIAILDYNVRGYTRDVEGRKVFIDKEMVSLQNCFRKETLEKYVYEDFNTPELRSFYTRMMHKDILGWKGEGVLWDEVEEIFLERRTGGD
jgi:S-adenosylmethionine decarboxylase